MPGLLRSFISYCKMRNKSPDKFKAILNKWLKARFSIAGMTDGALPGFAIPFDGLATGKALVTPSLFVGAL